MVQSLGISVGNLNSYVAAGQGGGIEILLNEYSNRSTPSMVAFTEHSRSIGVDASSNFMMNLKNTVYDLMVLLGRSYQELVSSNAPASYPFKIEEGAGGQALVVVRHLGQERKFTVTQVLAMLFTKLRGIAREATDCVISCPQFFTDTQKNALVHAALLAGLNPLQIISDMQAVVLNYAYFRTTKADPQKIIAFINLGHSNLQSVVAWLTPNNDTVRILASESEPVGGRDFDQLLAQHFVKTSNLNLNQKSHLKLVSSCEKLKKLLSSNANELPLHVESLISEDQDYTARIDRAKFEELSQDLLGRIRACLQRTLDAAKQNYQLMAKEMNEAIAKRAAEAEAKKNSKQAEPQPAAPAEQEPKSAASSSEEEVKMDQSEESTEAPATPAQGKSQKSPKQNVEGDCKQNSKQDAASKTAANENSKSQKQSPKENVEPLVNENFELSAVELVGGSTRIPAIKQLVQEVFTIQPSTTLNTDEAVARGCILHCATLHPSMKVRREVRILDADMFYRRGDLTCDKDQRRVELELITSDRKYRSRTEARNTLEEFIYQERSRLEEGNPHLAELNATLDWLFTDEGEEASEDDYTTRLNQLKKPPQEN